MESGKHPPLTDDLDGYLDAMSAHSRHVVDAEGAKFCAPTGHAVGWSSGVPVKG